MDNGQTDSVLEKIAGVAAPIVRAYDTITGLPDKAGEALGRIGVSDASRKLIEQHQALQETPPQEASMTNCAVKQVVSEFRENSVETCTHQEWQEGAVNDARNRITSELEGTGKRLLARTVGLGAAAGPALSAAKSAVNALGEHKAMIRTAAGNGMPGMVHGTDTFNGSECEYWGDASDPDKVRVYIESTDPSIVGPDGGPANLSCQSAAEQSVASRALESVHKYEQDPANKGTPYRDMIESVADGNDPNGYLAQPPAPETPPAALETTRPAVATGYDALSMGG